MRNRINMPNKKLKGVDAKFYRMSAGSDTQVSDPRITKLNIKEEQDI